MTDETLTLSHGFVLRCLRSGIRCVVDTHNAAGPFVAEWSGDVPTWRVRLVCGKGSPVIRVDACTMASHVAYDFSQAIKEASDVAALYEETDCGGTYAETAAAYDMTTPLGRGPRADADEVDALSDDAEDEWWAKRERPPERLDDVGPNETGEPT